MVVFLEENFASDVSESSGKIQGVIDRGRTETDAANSGRGIVILNSTTVVRIHDGTFHSSIYPFLPQGLPCVRLFIIPSTPDADSTRDFRGYFS